MVNEGNLKKDLINYIKNFSRKRQPFQHGFSNDNFLVQIGLSGEEQNAIVIQPNKIPLAFFQKKSIFKISITIFQLPVSMASLFFVFVPTASFSA